MCNVSSNISTPTPTVAHHFIEAHPDTGASGNYVMENENFITTPAAPLSVMVPNGHNIHSDTATYFAVPGVPPQANKARVFPTLKSGNLLSVGQYCNNNCSAHFYKTHMEIHNPKGLKIIEGPRDLSNDLWKIRVPISTPTSRTGKSAGPTVNALICTRTPKSEFVRFIHLAIGAPTKNAITKAIKSNFLETIPFMTQQNVNKFLHKSIETQKGHQQQQRMHTKILFQDSTSNSVVIPQYEDEEAVPEVPLSLQTHVILAAMHQVAPDKSDWAYGDLTGRYPLQSSQGYNYVLVVYHYDANAILVEGLRNREKATIMNGYKVIHERLKLCGCKPWLQVLDNEVSQLLMDYHDVNNIKIQLAPPHMHQQNAAERAIRTWKDHFVAIRAACNPAFPKQAWCRLLPQLERMLNLLQASRTQPKTNESRTGEKWF